MRKQTEKKKIFFILPNLEGGGAERVLLLLAEYLTRTMPRWSIALVVLSSDGAYRKMIPEGVVFHDLASPRARNAFFKLHQLCRRERPDIVISTMQATSIFFLVRLFLFTKPVFLSRLENVYTYDVQTLSPFVRTIFRIALEHCDQVIVPAKGMIDDLVRQTRVRKDRITYIPNPVAIDAVIAGAAKPLETPLVHPAIVMCGRLTEQKGYTYAIDAFIRIRETHPAAQLYILGEGEERLALEAYISEKGLSECVHLCGFSENPYAYIANADVFMLTSLWEGFGLVLVEAMACGTPVVSFDSPTGPREVLADGAYGTLVPLSDTARMADAVSACITDEDTRDTLIEKGRLRADGYAVDAVGQQYIDVCNAYG